MKRDQSKDNPHKTRDISTYSSDISVPQSTTKRPTRKPVMSYADLTSSTLVKANPVTNKDKKPIYFIDKETNEEILNKSLVDPLLLDELVSIHYFADYLRFNKKNYLDEEIRHLYDEYKAEFKKLQLKEMFEKHKDIAWFKEKYKRCEPQEESKHTLIIESYSMFVDKLKNGHYDDINNDETDINQGPPQQKDIIRIGKDSIFIKCIPFYMEKKKLEQLFEKEEGFIRIVISEVNPSKNFNRIAWVYFEKNTDLYKIVEKLNNCSIDNFSLYLEVHNKELQYFMPKTVPYHLMCTEKRLEIDIKQLNNTINTLEEITVKWFVENKQKIVTLNGIKIIHNRLKIINENMSNTTHLKDSENGSQNHLEILKKECDMLMIYLRHVFAHCYYCSIEALDKFELDHKCIAPHYRKKEKVSNDSAYYSQPNTSFLKLFDRRFNMKINQIKKVQDEFFGASRTDEEITNKTKELVINEDEKSKCSLCNKMFKSLDYFKKHLLNKHTDIIDNTIAKIDYYNNYALDPNRIIMPIKNKVKMVVCDYESSSYLLYRNNESLAHNEQTESYPSFSYIGSYPNKKVKQNTDKDTPPVLSRYIDFDNPDSE